MIAPFGGDTEAPPSFPLLEWARADRCRRSFAYFVRTFWPVIDPEPLRWSWHMEAICNHLQAVTEGKITRLIICIPPGHSKSLLVSVFWQAWQWLRFPGLRELYGSYDETLTLRDSSRCRDLILSDAYQALFRPHWSIRKDINSKSFFGNTEGGQRRTYYMKSSKKTGWRGNHVILDDPLSADDRYNSGIKRLAIDTWEKVLSTRVNDPATAAFVVIMQRLAEDDLVGHLISKYGTRWEQLILPTYFDPARRCRTSIGFEDPRQEPGELLFPSMFPRHVVEEAEQVLGPVDFSAQHQHDPIPQAGGRFDPQFFQFYDQPGNLMIRLKHRNGTTESLRVDYLNRIILVDVATSEKREADFTSIGIWALTLKSELVLLDRISFQKKEPDIINAIVSLYADRRWGRRPPLWVGIEANGPGKPIAQALTAKGLPVQEIHISQDKLVMSATALVRLQGGMIFFPEYDAFPWVREFTAQLTSFPGGKHDDDVSMLSLAANSVYEAHGAQIVGVQAITPEQRKDALHRRADVSGRGWFGTKDRTPR